MFRTVLLCFLLLPTIAAAQNHPPVPGQQPDDPAQSAWLAPVPPLFAPLPARQSPDSSPGQGVHTVRISGGVMAGQNLTKVPPVYPAEARQQRLQGPVVLAATIGTDGRVQDLQVISGNATLAASASEAVRQWTYKPYLLNGNPVQVKTTVTVNFNLADDTPANSQR